MGDSFRRNQRASQSGCPHSPPVNFTPGRSAAVGGRAQLARGGRAAASDGLVAQRCGGRSHGLDRGETRTLPHLRCSSGFERLGRLLGAHWRHSACHTGPAPLPEAAKPSAAGRTSRPARCPVAALRCTRPPRPLRCVARATAGGGRIDGFPPDRQRSAPHVRRSARGPGASAGGAGFAAQRAHRMCAACPPRPHASKPPHCPAAFAPRVQTQATTPRWVTVSR